MLIDARTLGADSLIETAVCIVGAGAAGITLAHESLDSRSMLSLIESGGLTSERATHSLYVGENGGLPYFPLDLNRQRSFGGSTNLWAGWCRPLDALDFASRPWVPDSGWPLSRTELLPYSYHRNTTPAPSCFSRWVRPLRMEPLATTGPAPPPPEQGQHTHNPYAWARRTLGSRH